MSLVNKIAPYNFKFGMDNILMGGTPDLDVTSNVISDSSWQCILMSIL